MNLRTKIAFNTLVQFIGRFVAGVINLFVIIVLTREFGSSTWSDYVTVTSYVVMFTLVADFGLNSIFVREVVQTPEKRDHFFRTLLSLRLGLAAVAIFIAIAILSFTQHSSGVKIGIIIGVLAISAQAISYSTNAVFQQVLRYDRAMLADIVGNFVLLVLVTALSVTGGSIFIIIAFYLLSNFVKAILGVFFVREYVSLGLEFDASYARNLLILAWPLGLTAVFTQIIANVDKQIVALSSYHSSLNIEASRAVGIYGLAYRVFDFAIAFPAFVTNSAFPALVEKFTQGQEELFKASRKVFLVLLGFGVIGLVATLLAAPLLVPIFGDYSEAVASLRILALSIPVFFVTSLGFALFIILKKEKLLPFIYGFALLFNFGANYYFVPRFGYNAAAWITLFTEGLILVSMAILLSGFLRNKNELS